MNIQELLIQGTSLLKEKNIPTSRLDSEILLGERLKKDRAYFLSHGDDVVSKQNELLFLEDIERRRHFEPIAYIIGKKEFMGFEFHINKNVLIPRPDTEILVETAIDVLKTNQKQLTILDIGTGSGAIAISLIIKISGVHITAVDIDPQALEVAENNANRLKIRDRITFVVSDCFNKVPKVRFDAILSNPPYINLEEMNKLAANVSEYKPHKALYGGVDGLDFYRKIIKEAPKYLNTRGLLMFEIGCTQGDEISTIMIENGFHSLHIVKDMAGLDRVIYGFGR